MIIPVWGNPILLALYGLIITMFIISAAQIMKYVKSRIRKGGISLTFTADILMKMSIAFVFCVSAWVRVTAATGSGAVWKGEFQFWLWLTACLLLLLAVILKVVARWGGHWDGYLFFSFEKGNRYFYFKRFKEEGGTGK